MYNRYTPQSDGSYKRDRMPEPHPSRPAPPPPYYPPQETVSCSPPPESPPCVPSPESYPPPKKEGIWGFMRQLLPKDFDTGDLLVILLLLLMAGDREEDRSNALLTLALYIFM